MSEKKLFLLDGMALVYRAFFAFSQNPRVTSYGLNTSAVFGFTNTLMDILQREKPTHIAVVFDTDKPTERHIEFTDYKAHRQEMPEDLSLSFPYIFRVIEGFNIPIITLDGYEADDLIGTLAKQAEKEGFTTYMMTPDKDFGQLVTDKIKIFKPGFRGGEYEILGPDEVCKRWGISNVDQVRDILGLMGDAVDNIPGIPGVGEKTAMKFIQEYGSLEGLLERTAELKGKMKEKVEENAELARLSKKLATIFTDSPITLDEPALRVEEPNAEALKALFDELEFRALTRKLFSQPEQQPGIQPDGQMNLFATDDKPQETHFKTIQNTPHDYKLITDDSAVKELIAQLLNEKAVCFDTETTSLNPLDAKLVGVALSCKAHQGWYIHFPENENEAAARAELLRPLLESGQVLKVAQNLKYDYAVMLNYGIEIKAPCFDTMLAHYVIEPDQRHGMDLLAQNLLGYLPVSITELIGKKGGKQGNMRDVDLETVKEYAAEDADITLQLKEKLDPVIDQTESRRVFDEIEMPLVPVLAQMERAGVRIDSDFLNTYSNELGEDARIIEATIYEMAGEKFNIASPKQLGEVLFDKMKLEPKPKKTKTGQYSTNEESLELLRNVHPIAAAILDIREIQKLKSTYVDALPQLVHPRTGRVHTSFNQAVAATGRLSSTNPNLQNIPIRTEKGREIRKAFIARDDKHILLSADYSQIELRIIAAISHEQAMIEDFRQGHDIHSATAAKVFGVALAEVDKEMRRKAKMVNFGIIYGISAFGLSQRLGIPRKEADQIITEYFRQYPGIKKYMNDTIDSARHRGFVTTLMGRRRYLRDINSANQTVRGFAERNAINAPIQGSAADMIKIAMIRIHRRLREEKLSSVLTLQVHDELLFDVHRPELEQVKDLVTHEMENAMPLEVPIVVESGTGNNWLEAH